MAEQSGRLLSDNREGSKDVFDKVDEFFGDTPAAMEALVPPEHTMSDAVGPSYTVNEAIDHIGFGRFQKLMLLYTGFAWTADAMEMMLLSFLGPAVRCEWSLSPMQESLITSVVFLGTMAGAGCWGALSDWKGRRVGFATTAAVTFLFGLASATAPSYAFLLLFRGCVGFALGGVPVAFALFMELTPTARRGPWLILLQAFWALGSMAEAALAWAVLRTLGWRYLLGFSALPLMLLLVFFPLLPESPHYLMVRGDVKRAREVLQRIARVNGTLLPPGNLTGAGLNPAEKQVQVPDWRQRLLGPAQALQASVRELFSPSLRVTTVLLHFIWVTNALAYYGLVLLATSVHASDSSKAACDASGHSTLSDADYRDIFITACGEVPGLAWAALFIDLWGRKWSQAVALFATTAFTVPLMWMTLGSGTWLMLGGRAFSLAAFVILYVYTPEVYPTSVRAFGIGVANAWSRIGGLVAPFVAVFLVAHNKAFLAEAIIAAFCFVAGLCVFLLPIETKGRALMETGEVELGPSDVFGRSRGQNGTAGVYSRTSGIWADAPDSPSRWRDEHNGSSSSERGSLLQTSHYATYTVRPGVSSPERL